ncbi:MAG: hypothetical protein ACXWIP_17795 [Burkholderiales bacterium]
MVHRIGQDFLFDWVLRSRQLGCLGLEQRASRVRECTDLAARANHGVFYDVEVEALHITVGKARTRLLGSQQRRVTRTSTPC